MTDILPEKWMKGVAVTTTVLAVLTAIAASRGAVTGAKIQLLTSVEVGKWGYYQAKSIKQHTSEMLVEFLEAQKVLTSAPEQNDLIDKKISAQKTDIARYDAEKTAIQKEAIQTGEESKTANRRAEQFNLSVVFFQIAIMLSSVSALIKRKEMWIGGILCGLIAIVFLANGLFLLF